MSRPSYVSLNGFDIHGRTLSWFKKVHPAIDPAPERRIYGLRTLPAAIALADMYGDRKGWYPDVDDLDIPQEDAASIAEAAGLLGIELPASLKSKLFRSS